MLSKSFAAWAAWVNLRNRRLPLFCVGCAITLGLALSAPRNTSVILRDLEADPWRIIWCLPATFLPLCLDSTLDHMEQALPRPLWSRRAGALVAAVSCASIGVVITAQVVGRSPVPALTGLLLMLGLCLLIAVILGATIGGVMTFTFVLANWVFGLSDHTLEPHSWAVLMQHTGAWDLAAAAIVFLLVSTLWSFMGSKVT